MGEQKKYWEGKHFAFYTNKECEYYPCHPVPEGTEFNCLFCYCPLYMLGRKCGGNFTYLESEGSSLYIPRCTWKKRPTAMRRRALF